MRKRVNKLAGYTLMEAMVVLAIVSILITMAAPSFRGTIADSQLSSAAEGLFSLVRYARAEAARQGSTVLVGAADGVNWGNGAIAWVEGDNVAGFDPANDTLIRRLYVKGKVKIVDAISNSKIIQFNGQGYTPTAVRFEFCDGRPDEQGRTINILVSGFSVMSVKEDCL